MKVISPGDLIHTISIIPRFNEITDITMEATNEATKVVSDGILTSYSLNDGVGVIEFTMPLGVEDKEKYTFVVLFEDTQIVYKGKFLVSNQETQDYKITKDLYFYE